MLVSAKLTGFSSPSSFLPGIMKSEIWLGSHVWVRVSSKSRISVFFALAIKFKFLSRGIFTLEIVKYDLFRFDKLL